SICSALPCKPATSNSAQIRGTSESDRTRSRLCGVTLDAMARVDLNLRKFLSNRPFEDGARARQYLISDDGGLDAAHQRPDVGATYISRVEFGPLRQQMFANKRIGLPPALISALGICCVAPC